MVLAYVGENPQTGAEQLKWMSSDKAMIVTENGRIVQTLLLPYENLSGLAFQPLGAFSSANNSSADSSSAFDVSITPEPKSGKRFTTGNPTIDLAIKQISPERMREMKRSKHR